MEIHRPNYRAIVVRDTAPRIVSVILRVGRKSALTPLESLRKPVADGMRASVRSYLLNPCSRRGVDCDTSIVDQTIREAQKLIVRY